ncbi:hypothetical protein NQ314_015710, partial [Rhamnusium bicolor]
MAWSLIFTKELVNVTRDPGKVVKLICEVQNLDTNNTIRVSFNWKHNEVPVEYDNRFRIKNVKIKDNVFRSTLRISKLDYFDRGFWDCLASNGADKIKSVAFLEINQSHKW